MLLVIRDAFQQHQGLGPDMLGPYVILWSHMFLSPHMVLWSHIVLWSDMVLWSHMMLWS